MRIPQALSMVAPATRPALPALAGAAVLALLRSGTTLASPWPLAVAVDHGLTGPGATRVLVGAGLATVLISALSGLLGYASTVVGARAAEGIGMSLRERVFGHAVALPLRWHDRIPSGELLSRLTTDIGRLLDGIGVMTATLLPDTVLLVIVLAVLLAFDPELALVGLAVVPVLAVLAIRQRRRVRAAQQDARAASGRLSATTSDLLRNVRAVQAFGRADLAAEIFTARSRAVRDSDVRAATVSARWSPRANIVLATGAGLVLVVGGRHVLAGTLSVGDLLVVLSYLGNLYSPVRGLTRLSGVLAKAGASATRVRDVLGAEVPARRGTHPAPSQFREIRFEQVRFSYEPSYPVLTDFDLRVQSGETVALLGPSGIGKSTILHLLLRLYEVDSGRVLLDGVDIRDYDRDSLCARIAFVPQDPWLLDATLAENIAFGAARATRSQILDAGRAALVDEFAAGLPQGYDTPLGEGGVRLSGGQRRRVALARAAISTAPIVLLDEPTASLDPVSSAGIVRAIRSATARRTVLLVTHDRELARIADRVVVLDSRKGGDKDGHHHRPDLRPVAYPFAQPQPFA